MSGIKSNIQSGRNSKVKKLRSNIENAKHNRHGRMKSGLAENIFDLSIQRRIYDLNGTFIRVFRAHRVRV